MEKIILDIDPGIDDSLALILAVQSGEFDIIGVTISSGNVDSDQGAANASYVLKLLDQQNIPIYQGRSQSIYQPYTDARDTHGQDGLGEVIFATGSDAGDQPAAEFIVDQLLTHPGEISLVALGPLTNLADALDLDDQILTKAKNLRIMGGVHTVNGNCSPVAEYNFWCDPLAAKVVFDAALPATWLYTLDVTYDILLTPNMREMIKQFGGSLADFVYAITRFYVDFHWQQERTLGCVINDPLVIADMIRPMTDFFQARIDMVVDGPNRGQAVMVADTSSPIHVSDKVDAQAFFDYFLKTLFPEHRADIDLMQAKGMI
ncbi:hypothetical protein AWM75_00050 [Aerococcus urinaehominis]|uniref:Uncharacterized protein n=1 Tax=Aerococcus urinaehominis TaxID=128944 RepID=A0A0X8FJH7_9LACT|nr:nucleoside hydrolase [Aerococcus urinaehominis]AMB98478.1 hypothetical protein AWM75_00050 [Aerococcus urinaehominis]SDL81561.1 purine nucleosidase [Aerococcus urinaehominis]